MSKYNILSPEKYSFLGTIKWLSVSSLLQNILTYTKLWVSPWKLQRMLQGYRQNCSTFKAKSESYFFFFLTLQNSLNTSQMLFVNKSVFHIAFQMKTKWYKNNKFSKQNLGKNVTNPWKLAKWSFYICYNSNNKKKIASNYRGYVRKKIKMIKVKHNRL